ncbi:hypothetical protein HZ326_8022 [Fusarium oxysporum f. sp. albedinis]|nr:hypothetical protein HZ326_8022 [Fusarium oxysporum f. sp. albedinis]
MNHCAYTVQAGAASLKPFGGNSNWKPHHKHLPRFMLDKSSLPIQVVIFNFFTSPLYSESTIPFLHHNVTQIFFFLFSFFFFLFISREV